MSTARDVIRASLDLPDLLDRIGDDDDLIAAGVNSGEMVRLALHCEEALGRLLSDDELAQLATVRAVTALLSEISPGTAAG